MRDLFRDINRVIIALIIVAGVSFSDAVAQVPKSFTHDDLKFIEEMEVFL